MKKITRRNFLQATGLASIGGLMAGCGASSSATASSGSASTGGDASSKASDVLVGATSGYEDDPNEQVTLKWVLYTETLQNTDAVFEEFNKRLAEYLPNTKVEFLCIDGPSYDEQTKLILASGEYFDAMWAGDWKGDSVAKLGGGAFMPVQDLMNDFAPDLRDFIPESSWAAGMFKGELYGVVSHQSLAEGVGAALRGSYHEIYGDIIDSAEIEKFSSWENRDVTYAQVCRKFEPLLEKAMEDGRDKVEPLVNSLFYEQLRQTETIYMLTSLAPIIGIERGTDKLEVVCSMATDEAREVAALTAEWNKKGYLPKDVATFLQLPFNTFNSFMGIGNYALPGTQTTAQAINLYGEDNINIGVIIPPYNGAMANPQANYFYAKGKNPARTMRFFDTLVRNVDLYNFFCFGNEGADYTMQNGVATLNENQTYKMRDWLVGNTDYSLGRAADADYLKESNEVKAAAPSAAITGFNFDITNVKTEIAAVTSVFDEYYDSIRFGVFKDEWEEKYDEFLAKLDVAGIADIIAEAQAQVDIIAAAQGVK